jgi:ketosteroid isomerase-like protein
MSENLDLVRSIYAAWERGDYSSTAWADAEIEIVFADGPSPGTFQGLAGVTRGFRDFVGAWDEWHSEAEGYRELDDQRVLAFVRFSGRGKRSGMRLEALHAKGASVFHLRDGKVTRQVFYLDRDRALADLGLKE